MPIGTGGADIDHVVIGPAGVVTINTKHHRAGRLVLGGDELIVSGRATDYVPKARREAQRAHAILGQALVMAGATITAARLQVRPIIAVVGGRVLIESWAAGIAVVMTRQLVHAVTSAPPLLDREQVEEVFAVARYRPTWSTTVT